MSPHTILSKDIHVITCPCQCYWSYRYKKNLPLHLIHKFIFIFSVKSKCNVVGHKMNKIKGTENTFEHTNKTEGVCKTRH